MYGLKVEFEQKKDAARKPRLSQPTKFSNCRLWVCASHPIKPTSLLFWGASTAWLLRLPLQGALPQHLAMARPNRWFLQQGLLCRRRVVAAAALPAVFVAVAVT